MKVKDVMKEIACTLMISKMNDVKIHIKVESLVKSALKTFESYEDQSSRAIVWMRYAVSAIFVGMFNEILIRL